jgi:hypothetical protein
MLKGTKLTLAALLLAGTYGLAAAQGTGGAGGNSGGAEQSGVASGKPANADNKQKVGTPATGGAAMQQKNTGMAPANTKAPSAGPNETGTAKDTAGSGALRDPAKQTQPKQ